jgi:GAF domain-containing protein
MSDQSVLFQALTKFSRTLSGQYDVSDVLYELSEAATRILSIAGAGVSVADHTGTLRFVTATDEIITCVEQVQQDTQEGPCHQAYTTGEAVYVTDLTTVPDWPHYRASALGAGLCAVAGIPMGHGATRLGSLDVYDQRVREWSEDDRASAQVLADMATGYIIHASQLEQAQRINEQLQTALDSRVLIEQAKGLLAGERHISLDEAWTLIRDHARRRNAPARSVAQAIVELGMRP